MFNSFSHYLSYGAQDQTTVRSLEGKFDGLVVPGTIASFQKEGTGGFVLSFSALPTSPNYVIDPRFPLYQQRLPKVKSAHTSLAAVLGRPSLANGTTTPMPGDFPAEVVDEVSRAWADFNLSYRTANTKKFDKYSKRLMETVSADDATGPAYVLPPYFMSSSIEDPWWRLSKEFVDATLRELDGQIDCRRVVAATSADAVAELALDTSDNELVIWVSNFEEAKRSVEDLVSYARAIRKISAAGKTPFALYGGFYSVLLASFGLAGSSHGIGFSEHRNWEELPSSGGPPARFYVPRLHRFMQPDEADVLYDADPELVRCECVECGGKSPLDLEYHELMMHSVRCRANEIDEFAVLATTDMAGLLDAQTTDFFNRLDATSLHIRFRDRIREHRKPIDRWCRALRAA